MLLWEGPGYEAMCYVFKFTCTCTPIYTSWSQFMNYEILLETWGKYTGMCRHTKLLSEMYAIVGQALGTAPEIIMS